MSALDRTDQGTLSSVAARACPRQPRRTMGTGMSVSGSLVFKGQFNDAQGRWAGAIGCY